MVNNRPECIQALDHQNVSTVRKTQPSAAAGKASTTDPDYQPPEGAPEGDSDEESVSDTKDVINPLTDQEIYIYDC